MKKRATVLCGFIRKKNKEAFWCRGFRNDWTRLLLLASAGAAQTTVAVAAIEKMTIALGGFIRKKNTDTRRCRGFRNQTETAFVVGSAAATQTTVVAVAIEKKRRPPRGDLIKKKPR